MERWNDEFCDFNILKEKIILYLYTLYTLKMYRSIVPQCSAGRGTVESGSVGRWVGGSMSFVISIYLKRKYIYILLYYILYTLKNDRSIGLSYHI